jgi:hypothetical protein
MFIVSTTKKFKVESDIELGASQENRMRNQSGNIAELGVQSSVSFRERGQVKTW